MVCVTQSEPSCAAACCGAGSKVIVRKNKAPLWIRMIVPPLQKAAILEFYHISPKSEAILDKHVRRVLQFAAKAAPAARSAARKTRRGRPSR